jgi:hypothetical protein
MRTGPCTSTGPHATTRTARRWVLLAVVRPDRHYLRLATATAQLAGAFQPLRPCRERWAERNPLPGNYISVQAGGPHRWQMVKISDRRFVVPAPEDAIHGS